MGEKSKSKDIRSRFDRCKMFSLVSKLFGTLSKLYAWCDGNGDCNWADRAAKIAAWTPLKNDNMPDYAGGVSSLAERTQTVTDPVSSAVPRGDFGGSKYYKAGGVGKVTARAADVTSCLNNRSARAIGCA